MNLNSDERWVEEASFLCRLLPEEQQRFFQLARRVQVAPGEDILDGESVALLLRGEVTRDVENSEHVGHGGAPGRLFGAGALFGERGRPVVAHTPVEVARVPVASLREPSAWALREVLSDLAELEFQIEVLDDVLRHQPTLRLLPFDQREILLQCSTLRELQAGQLILEAGVPPPALVLVLRGNARLSDRDVIGEDARRLGQLLPAGTLVGVQDFTSDTPPAQPYRITAASVSRVLEIPWRALRQLANRNRALSLRTAPAAGGGRRGSAHLVLGACGRLGASALALGAGVALVASGFDAAVLDLDAHRTRRIFGLRAERAWLEGIEVWRTPAADGTPAIYQAVDANELEPLIDALVRLHPHLMVNAAPGELPPQGVMDRVTTLVHLHTPEFEHCRVPVGPQQRLIHALRLPEAGVLPAPRSGVAGRALTPAAAGMQQILRVPEDPAVGEVYQGKRVLRQLGMGETPFGRAAERLARMLLGRAVGLALGGGGAWGFAHIGLLRALHDEGVPVDYVAGTSFGAVVGAAWVARGPDGLDRLVRYSPAMPAVAATCVLRTTLLGVFIDQVCGSVNHLATEVPLLAVASDAATSAPFVLPAGTLADAVRSSSGFPGLFAHYSFKEHRLVDGGVAANVPAEVVHQAGADFILASNVIPRAMDDAPRLGSAPVLGRALDLVRSTLALMHRSSARDADLADHVFNARLPGISPHEFHLGRRIAEMAYEQALTEIPAIRAAYEADLTTHVPQ